MEYDFENVSFQAITKSMTNGMEDHKFYLWVPDWLEDAEVKEYFVVKNTGTREEEKFEEVYHFTGEYIRNKCQYALSRDGKVALAGYAAKKGIICYNCETSEVIWNNKKIKKVNKIRFNNFDSNVIEAINDKLEITYIDKLTGEVLTEEQIANVKQVINWMRSSKNGKFLICADFITNKDKAIYTIYNVETKAIKGRFVAQSQINGSTFDITDNGEYAICSAYQRQGVSLVKVETGEVIWTKKNLSKISKVYFNRSDTKVVVCCQHDKNYLLEISDGEVDECDYNEDKCLNMYGNDIVFPESNIVRIGGKEIKSPSFSFLGSIGIPDGIVVNPTEKGLMLYDNNGNLLWENKSVSINNIVYQEETNTICGVVNIHGKGKIVIISAEDGSVVCEVPKEDFGNTFINGNKTLICNTGKMFDVSNRSIKETTEVFEFLIM